MLKVSRIFLTQLKLNEQPAYRVAQMAGIDPVVLSKLINGMLPLRPHDERIVAVGRILGLAAVECFEDDRTGDWRESR
jgi:hypothetical protein